MTRAVPGVDIGTSGSKSVLVALDGGQLATATREHTVQRPAIRYDTRDGAQIARLAERFTTDAVVARCGSVLASQAVGTTSPAIGFRPGAVHADRELVPSAVIVSHALADLQSKGLPSP